jgi:hypothetical protein
MVSFLIKSSINRPAACTIEPFCNLKQSLSRGQIARKLTVNQEQLKFFLGIDAADYKHGKKRLFNLMRSDRRLRKIT